MIGQKGKENYFYGKKHSVASKKKISLAASKRKGNKNPNYKGGYWKKNIPLFDTYAEKISYVEEVRRDPNDYNTLQVKCTYCGRWFTPKRSHVGERLKILVNGKTRGEASFYCSEDCKDACPIFRMRLFPKGHKDGTSREVQPELRKLVLERDNYTCQKCGVINTELHCHHFEGIMQNPIESADTDMCITLCKECHEEVHSKDGCRRSDLKCGG